MTKICFIVTSFGLAKTLSDETNSVSNHVTSLSRFPPSRDAKQKQPNESFFGHRHYAHGYVFRLVINYS
jgi:hypothetical protein